MRLILICLAAVILIGCDKPVHEAHLPIRTPTALTIGGYGQNYRGFQVAIPPPTAGVATLVAMSERIAHELVATPSTGLLDQKRSSSLQTISVDSVPTPMPATTSLT